MAEQFKHLFTPIKIGPVEVRNRIMSTGHLTGYTRDNLPTEQHAYYYAERAKGGIGLIVTEQLSVHVTSLPRPDVIFAYDERTIPGFQRITGMVHEHGARIMGQLNHSGMHSTSIHNMRETWAPSAIPCVRTRATPKAMEIENIKELICGYAQSARNLKAGGFDGAEIHGAHGYLPMQFLSPAFNKRTDEYGGSLENRLRFANEVVDAIRAECGSDFVVGLRISGDELMPGGLTLEDTREIARRLEQTGKLDYISVSIANYNINGLFVPPMFVPLGFAVYCAAGIKEAVASIPIFTIGRINDPLLAEKILADGHADVIGMTRANIADPELPNKAREGRLDDIRPCIACNEGCVGRLDQSSWVSCLQNPAAGREKKWGLGTMKPAPAKRKIVVVGGGPAGMEAARVAALRGHHVSLYEREERLGGQINVLTRAPSRQEFGGVVRWLSGQIDKLDVEVHLNTEMTPELVTRLDPDVVIVATGSLPNRTGFTPARPDLAGIPGADRDSVLTYWDVLLDPDDTEDTVVVIDDDHGTRALCTAELLAGRGKKVEVICRLPAVGAGSNITMSFPFVYPKLVTHGALLHTDSWCREIADRKVVVFNIYTNEEKVIQDVGTVVLATGHEADDRLHRALKGRVRELHAIGDCLAPRKAMDAIFDGHRVGREV